MNKVIPNGSGLVLDEAQIVFKGRIFDSYQWEQTLFDGSLSTFEMLKRTDTVVAICIVEDKVIVLDDEQPHSGSRKSLPGGRIDDEDATALDAAKREVLEETGYSFKSWRLIKVAQPSEKIEWFVNLFIAYDIISKTGLSLDAGEKIEVHLMGINSLKQLSHD